MIQMKQFHTFLFLLILSISFSSSFTLPWNPGFGSGVIDLGGLLICEIKNLTEVWRLNEGVATFYEPSALPDGFYMLGSYFSNSNTKPLSGVVAGKDATNDTHNAILKSPTDYNLIPSPTFPYIWQPIAPEGYTAVGHFVTASPQKPPLDKIRCVRSDFVVASSVTNEVIFSECVSGFNIYTSVSDKGGIGGVPTGTFLVHSNESTTATPSVPYLKNVAGNLSGMPSKSQIDELMKKYSPAITFHPDEEFFPSSVPWFFEHGGLLFTKDQNSNPVLIGPVTESNMPQGGSNDGLYWLDFPYDDYARSIVKKGNLQEAITYLHIKPSLGATSTDIVIYIFYPFNGPSKAKLLSFHINFKKLGEHVGDWEHVTLRISNFDGILKSVYFSQHSGGEWVDASQLEYAGSKPVVYSSLHGHAAYANAGDHMMGNKEVGLRNEAARGGVIMDTGNRFEIMSASHLNPPVVEPYWLNYARAWGPKVTYDISDEINKVTKFLPGVIKRKLRGFLEGLPKEVLGEEGPVGPKWKDSWDGDERVPNEIEGQKFDIV